MSSLALKSTFILLLLSYVIISCKKEENGLAQEEFSIETPVVDSLSKPENLNAISDSYSIKLSWRFNDSVESVHVFKGESHSSLRPYMTIKKDSVFTDTTVGFKTPFFYQINFENNNVFSEKSETVSSIGLEPIKEIDSTFQFEVGGIFYADFNFPKSHFFSLSHELEIHEPLTIKDTIDYDGGVFWNFYQGVINDIGFYYGIQNLVNNPNGEPLKGAIFSRWETRDTLSLSVPAGSFFESAGYEGDFISVRKNIDWDTGVYRSEIRKDSTDGIGDWYSFHFNDIEKNLNFYIGSLRFENKNSSKGIQNGGGSWMEIYSKGTTNEIPRWHVSVNNIIADHIYKPQSVKTQYHKDVWGITKLDPYSNIFTSNLNDVNFLIGPRVVQYHSATTYITSN